MKHVISTWLELCESIHTITPSRSTFARPASLFFLLVMAEGWRVLSGWNSGLWEVAALRWGSIVNQPRSVWRKEYLQSRNSLWSRLQRKRRSFKHPKPTWILVCACASMSVPCFRYIRGRWRWVDYSPPILIAWPAYFDLMTRLLWSHDPPCSASNSDKAGRQGRRNATVSCVGSAWTRCQAVKCWSWATLSERHRESGAG